MKMKALFSFKILETTHPNDTALHLRSLESSSNNTENLKPHENPIILNTTLELSRI
jgi:hypothetical protein